MKLFDRVKLFFAFLFRGMKQADTVLTTSHDDADAGNTPIEEKVQEENLWAALLRGEVTQEVKDLRYEMYESVRKAEEFTALGFSGRAVKKNSMLTTAPEHIDKSDGLPVILVQDNMLNMEGRDEAMANISAAADLKYEIDAEHQIKATHDGYVSLRLERLARRVVVKKLQESDDFKLDFYLSEFPIENEPRSIYASKELKSLFESGSRTSDFTNIKTITFQTYKAYGDKDWKVYDFTIIKYLGIKKYDGNYILSFSASLPTVKDLVEEYYDEVSVDKFKKKTPRKKTSTISLKSASEMITEEEEKIDEGKANDLLKEVKKKKNK